MTRIKPESLAREFDKMLAITIRIKNAAQKLQKTFRGK